MKKFNSVARYEGEEECLISFTGATKADSCGIRISAEDSARLCQQLLPFALRDQELRQEIVLYLLQHKGGILRHVTLRKTDALLVSQIPDELAAEVKQNFQAFINFLTD